MIDLDSMTKNTFIQDVIQLVLSEAADFIFYFVDVSHFRPFLVDLTGLFLRGADTRGRQGSI